MNLVEINAGLGLNAHEIGITGLEVVQAIFDLRTKGSRLEHQKVADAGGEYGKSLARIGDYMEDLYPQLTTDQHGAYLSGITIGLLIAETIRLERVSSSDQA